MKDSIKYLQFMHDRLINIHRENENVDFLIHAREAIAYTTELEAQVAESMGYVDDMIKDRDAFHDRNTELEKRIEVMKCCGNCLNYSHGYKKCLIGITERIGLKCENWQKKEHES